MQQTMRSARTDIAIGIAALGLVVAAGVYAYTTHTARDPSGELTPRVQWPILAHWGPHIGVGTPLAVLTAVAVVLWGPALAARLPWRTALATAYGAALVWTFSLALAEGWRQGLADKLTTVHEYLEEVPRITDIPTMLRTFTDRVLDYQPDSWVTHVSGHPPAATLTFVWLDRLGLGGGSFAAVLCVLVGASAVAAVAVALRALGDEDRARAALPFLVLFPGAVWIGVSADAVFTGVTAWGIALLAVSAVALREGAAWARWGCLGAGAVLGYGIFLSYGLVLMGTIAVGVLIAARTWTPLLWAVPGALLVVGVFALAGFWWLEGYHLVVERYYQGIASLRPYGYWVWANIACLVLAVGVATVAGVRHARGPGLALVLGALAAVLFADLSGLSKAEVERIWLPFAVWLVAAAAYLPARRSWLAAQAAVALAVNHLFLISW